jgi:hypothetical protein
VERFLGIAVLAALVLVPVFFLWGKRAFDRAAAESLRRIYATAEAQARAFGPSTPQVEFTYHTYSGLLLYVTQSEHRFRLPYPLAQNTLSALLKHTMKYGFFAYGALLIPVLAYLNYLAQGRSLRKQAERPSGARLKAAPGLPRRR